MADTTVPFNATFGLAAGATTTAIILEDSTIKPNFPQSYTALQSFSGGISAAGGITFNGTLVGVTATFNRLLTASAGFSAAGGITFNGTVASNSGYQITSATINGQTGTSYSLTASDNGKIITMSNGATSTVTIIAGLPVGYSTMVIQLGTGQVGFTAASGVTMNAYASGFKISGQHGAASIVSYATNIFNVSGTLSV